MENEIGWSASIAVYMKIKVSFVTPEETLGVSVFNEEIALSNSSETIFWHAPEKWDRNENK